MIPRKSGPNNKSAHLKLTTSNFGLPCENGLAIFPNIRGVTAAMLPIGENPPIDRIGTVTSPYIKEKCRTIFYNVR